MVETQEPDREAAVRFTGMRKRYGTTVAVDGLDLAVQQGEMFGLIGPDGAGKTSTLRVGLGLLRPDAGAVSTCGLVPHRRRRMLAHQIGYLSQRFSLYGDLSVDENISFFARIHGVRGWRERRSELLDLVRLTPFRNRLAERLSGGMKQKLALACTLIHRPRLLVLDEPTTGVDPVSRRDFWRLLVELNRQGLTILMTTPYLDEAERCRRVGLLYQGRLLALGDPQELRRSRGSRTGTMLEILAHPPRQAAALLRTQQSISGVEIFGERLHVATSETGSHDSAVAEQLSSLLHKHGISVKTCRPTTPTLEDFFISEIRAAEAGTGADPASEEVA